MKRTIEQLQNYEWNGVGLFGEREDENSWYWAKKKSHINDVFLGTAQEILLSSTPYETLVWEMEHTWEEEGYEEEESARRIWEAEEYEIVLPNLRD